MPRQNSSKYAICLECENPCSFYRFSFCAILLLFPNQCSGRCQHRPGGIHYVQKYSSTKWKTTWVFVFQKYSKFWRVLLGQKLAKTSYLWGVVIQFCNGFNKNEEGFFFIFTKFWLFWMIFQKVEHVWVTAKLWSIIKNDQILGENEQKPSSTWVQYFSLAEVFG